MATSNRRLLESAAVAGVVAVVSAFYTPWQVAVLAGWCAGAATFLLRVASTVAGFGAGETQSHATEEDPSLLLADVTLIVAAGASLVGVGFVLAKAGESAGLTKGLSAAVAALSVGLAWLAVQTIFTLRYARLYYDGHVGGIEFGDEAPDYHDFAYVAFTVGMTYQLSDTAVTDRMIRRVVLRHALLSFVFATAFIAVLINVVGGLF